MTSIVANRFAAAAHVRAQYDFERQSHKLRVIKIVCGVVLGVCFWYSVPYYLPLKMDPNPKIAAANEAAAYEGNFSRQVAMPIVALIAAYVLWRLPKRGKFGSRLMPIACAYVGWALLSATWSTDPSITSKRLVVFAINCFFAFTLARVLSVLELASFGFAHTHVVALISLYVDLIQEKTFAPGNPDYRFTGVMTANYQAMNLVVGMICAMTLAQKRPQWIRWIAPIMGVSLILLYLTRSRLGMILGLLMLSILVVRYARQNFGPQARALAVVVCLAVVVPGLIYAVGRNGGGAAQSAFMMGRTDTENTSNLSNRAPLWAELMESVDDRPWIGYGYEAFWTPTRVEKISADQGWMVPHAHDTYLDQTLSLGVIGTGLYVSMMLGGCVMAWLRFKRKPSEISLLPAVLLTWICLTGIAESAPLDPYLPTMIAYSCIVRMCMVEDSEAESDSRVGPEIITGLPRLTSGDAPSAPVRPRMADARA